MGIQAISFDRTGAEDFVIALPRRFPAQPWQRGQVVAKDRELLHQNQAITGRGRLTIEREQNLGLVIRRDLIVPGDLASLMSDQRSSDLADPGTEVAAVPVELVELCQADEQGILGEFVHRPRSYALRTDEGA